MNKRINIAAAIGISAFLATNLFLLFSDKSVIHKSVHVRDYERMTTADYHEKLPKESFVTPTDTYTVYVGSDDAIDSWLITEGDAVFAGDELALLNTENADNERDTWEAERTALYQQENQLDNLIDDLLAEKGKVNRGNNSSLNTGNSKVAETGDRTTIELDFGVDLNIDITQDGTYAQAIAAAEQELADVTRKLAVVDAQLAQNPSHPAILSPVDGVVAEVTRHGSTLAVDIYSSQKVLTTYAKDKEWKDVEMNDRVLLQGEGIDGIAEGTILSVSPVPTKNAPSLEAYKTLDGKEAKNPLAYYELRISTDADLYAIPFGNNVNATVITKEALDAASVNEQWLRGIDDEVTGTIIDTTGRAVKVPVTTPFTWNKRAVITEGIFQGDIVLDEALVRDFVQPPRIILRAPAYMPSKSEWRMHGWRNYVKHIIVP